MRFIDAAIPGIVGLVLLFRPHWIVRGSRAAPTPKTMRVLRICGIVLVLVAALRVVLELVGK